MPATLTYDHRMAAALAAGDAAEVARLRELMLASCEGCGNGPATEDGSPCPSCEVN